MVGKNSSCPLPVTDLGVEIFILLHPIDFPRPVLQSFLPMPLVALVLSFSPVEGPYLWQNGDLPMISRVRNPELVRRSSTTRCFQEYSWNLGPGADSVLCVANEDVSLFRFLFETVPEEVHVNGKRVYHDCFFEHHPVPGERTFQVSFPPLQECTTLHGITMVCKNTDAKERTLTCCDWQ